MVDECTEVSVEALNVSFIALSLVKLIFGDVVPDDIAGISV